MEAKNMISKWLSYEPSIAGICWFFNRIWWSHEMKQTQEIVREGSCEGLSNFFRWYTLIICHNHLYNGHVQSSSEYQKVGSKTWQSAISTAEHQLLLLGWCASDPFVHFSSKQHLWSGANFDLSWWKNAWIRRHVQYIRRERITKKQIYLLQELAKSVAMSCGCIERFVNNWHILFTLNKIFT